MIVSAVVATDLNGVIGVNGQMPWHLPDELKRFKELTIGKPVIMGRKTHESIGKVLPGRLNVVLSRCYKEGLYLRKDELLQSNSLETTLDWLKLTGTSEVSIIGGEEIYRVAEPYIDVIYKTTVYRQVELKDGDCVARFPIRVSNGDWVLSDESSSEGYGVSIYRRIK